MAAEANVLAWGGDVARALAPHVEKNQRVHGVKGALSGVSVTRA